jgi:hypothetical protein
MMRRAATSILAERDWWHFSAYTQGHRIPMPCPYFEPRNIVEPRRPNARLPLIDEYDGLCHADSAPVEAPVEVRFRYCNHGYSRGCCERFPSVETRSSLRYTVVRHTGSALDLICIEEQNYTPLRWRALQYLLESECLEPEIDDACMRAQAVAFCRSYLKHLS